MKRNYNAPQTTVSTLFAAKILLVSGGETPLGNVDNTIINNSPGD